MAESDSEKSLALSDNNARQSLDSDKTLKGSNNLPHCDLSRVSHGSLEKEDSRRRANKKKVGILVKPTDALESDPRVQQRRLVRKTTKDGGVKFGLVEIYEHPIVIGNNPGGFFGPPITIGWDAQSELKISLDEFEETRPPRRTASQMNIPQSVRFQMLRNAGYTRGEIQMALRDVSIARRERRRTIEIMNLAPMHELSEKILRGSLNLTIHRWKKAKERAYIKDALEIHRAMEQHCIACDELSDCEVPQENL